MSQLLFLGMMAFLKEQQSADKHANKIRRPLPFTNRTPLTALFPRMEVQGVVISVTPFGAFIDVGTDCDGFLHISQLSSDKFITHPRHLLHPGMKVKGIWIQSLSPELKKLRLSMLSPELWDEYKYSPEGTKKYVEQDDRISVKEFEVDDEVWGEIKRVTDYGAYVEVGAVVEGFLHFMDHPAWSKGLSAQDIMSRGDRVRIWVSNVDLERQRVQLTANRPRYLPGPGRD